MSADGFHFGKLKMRSDGRGTPLAVFGELKVMQRLAHSSDRARASTWQDSRSAEKFARFIIAAKI